MSEGDNSGGRRNYRQGHINRDDTPSIIRDVERLTSVPSRASMANLPVLEMPRSQRIWRRIRIPFFITVVVLLLLTVALVTHSIKVATSIAGTIDEALGLESVGTVEQTRLAEKMLAKLSEKHPRDQNAAAGWAWQVVLQNILYKEPIPEAAKEVLADLDDDIPAPYAFAARAGRAYIDGNLKEAKSVCDRGLALHPADPRISLVQILVMDADGDGAGAWNALMTLLETQKGYVPLIVAGADMALAHGNRLDALDLTKVMLGTSHGNLFGEMLMVHLGLPAWGEPEMSAEQLATLQKKYQQIAPRLGAAPPKLKTMGYYLKGRLLLVAGNPGEAIVAFNKALVGNSDPEILAWCAKALRKKSTAKDALALLDAHRNIVGPAVFDIRAELLLEYHRVKQAGEAIVALKKSGVLPQRLKELSWVHAVRSGDVARAKQTLPDKISGDLKWPALEMYFVLKRVGDTGGIEALTKALDGEWGTCSRVIRSWHSRNMRRATRLFENKRLTCAEDLIPRLMGTHIDAELVAQYAENSHEKNHANPIFEVDRAKALWRFEGHAAGEKILDQVAALKPEGIPLLHRLAEAYVTMNLPEKALAVLGDSEEPELLAQRIFALEAAKRKGEAKRLIQKAVKRSQTSDHPVYAFFKLRDLWQARDLDPIKAWIDANFVKKTVGEWSSEIADIGARALIALDLREEAEDLLEKLSKQVVIPSGADEAIDCWLADVSINISKGGRHRNRALVIIRTLREEGVMDPNFSYWLGVESIVNGSERLGLKFIKEALTLDGAFKPAWAKMAEMEWMGEQTATRMRNMLPDFNPPGAPPAG